MAPMSVSICYNFVGRFKSTFQYHRFLWPWQIRDGFWNFRMIFFDLIHWRWKKKRSKAGLLGPWSELFVLMAEEPWKRYSRTKWKNSSVCIWRSDQFYVWFISTPWWKSWRSCKQWTIIACNVRESNPGLPRGRREFYHWTNVAWHSQFLRWYLYFIYLAYLGEHDLSRFWI